MLVLVLLGALTKSAQFPFHFWLPHAMAAPTPVSAYLHSATMVKAGVFLLARLWPVLAGTEPWFWLVGGAGLATLLLGAYVAMFQNDLKGLLAYSTISHLGLITLLLGLNSPLAAVAAVFHIMNHATFKASLFMAAGIIDHETGTRDIRRLTGLFRAMPITGTLALVASAAMAGVPLLNGFLSKEMFFAETVFVSSHPWVEIGLPLAATLAGVFAVVYSLRFGHDIFFGPPPTTCRASRTSRRAGCACRSSCWCSPAWSSASRRRGRSARCSPPRRGPSSGGPLPEYSLAVWHGFNAPLVMSLVAMAGGGVGYLVAAPPTSASRPSRVHRCRRFDGKRAVRAHARGSDRAWPAAPRALWRHAAAAAADVGDGRRWPRRRGARVRGYAARLGRPAARAAAPAFVLLWLIGIVCAVGAASQAKFHRLAALTMLAAPASSPASPSSGSRRPTSR